MKLTFSKSKTHIQCTMCTANTTILFWIWLKVQTFLISPLLQTSSINNYLIHTIHTYNIQISKVSKKRSNIYMHIHSTYCICNCVNPPLLSDCSCIVQKHCKAEVFHVFYVSGIHVSFWLTGSEGARKSCDLQAGSPAAWKTQRTRLSLITVIFYAHVSCDLKFFVV